MKRILTVVLMVVALQLLVVSAIYAAPPAQGGDTQQGTDAQGGDPQQGADAQGGYGGGGYGYGGGYGGGWCGGGGCYYTVQYGDTLYSIGRRFGVYPYYIAEANGLYNPHQIYAGQVLYIPSGGGGYGGGCNPQPCQHPGYQQSGSYGCGQQGCGGCNPQPCQYPSYHGGYQGCGNQGCGNQGCGNWGCGYYGYDFTGYYYGNYYGRYSHTCGYYYNCW